MGESPLEFADSEFSRVIIPPQRFSTHRETQEYPDGKKNVPDHYMIIHLAH